MTKKNKITSKITIANIVCVRISKKKYLDMIKNRYISTLIPLSKKQLIQGIQEIELNYKNKLKFKDKLTCIIL